MPKRKCSINDNIRREFPFIKGVDENVECTLCNCKFCISHGGRSDVLNHVKTKKHKGAVQSTASNSCISNFLNAKTQSEMEKQLSLAAQEATFAYHTAVHNHSFKSMDCTTAIVKKLFNDKFRCSQTKCKAIITNVIAPFATKQIDEELKEARFISVLIDSSNHLDKKLVPLVVRYYHAEKGVKVKVLELANLGGETSELLFSYVLEVLQKLDLLEKVIAVSADNTNTNFGGKKRKGKNNLYFKMQENTVNNLIGIGCPAHVIHNAVQTAADCLPIDLQLIINKIYQHFHIYCVRVEELKSFCEFTNTEYKTVLGNSKTRWLSLLPAVQRVIDIFPALKSYFLSIDKCPISLKNFFENPLSITLLHFLASQLKTFSDTIKCVEKQEITVIEVKDEVNKLVEKLNCRKAEKFLTTTVRNQLQELEKEGHITVEKFESYAIDFYDTCTEYIQEWCTPFLTPLQSMDWINLKGKEPVTWKNIQESYIFMKTVSPNFTVNEEDLFDEFACVKKYCESKFEVWSELKDQSISEKWCEMFAHFTKQDINAENLKCLVSFCLALPGSNAAVERVFSLLNALWTDEKNRLKIETVKALTIVKTHFKDFSCAEFYVQISKENKLLEQVHKSDKYSDESKI